MNRYSLKQKNVTVNHVAIADSAEVVMSELAHGRIFVPSGSSITSLTFYEALPNTPDQAEETDWYACHDENYDALVKTVAAGKSYPIPWALSGSSRFKMLGDAAGVVHVLIKT